MTLASSSSSSKSSKKQKRSQTTLNPLAAARPKSKSLESIWHVKSGYGYQLFVDYYYHQAPGIVSEAKCQCCVTFSRSDDGRAEADKAIKTTKPSAVSTFASSTAPGKGLSRASMRRKKRKGEAIDQVEVENKATAADVENDEQTNVASEASTSRTINARLLQYYQTAATSNCTCGFAAFIRTLTRPLPVTFRVRTHQLPTVRNQLLKQLQQSANTNANVSLTLPTTMSTSKLILFSVPDASLLKKPQYAPLAELLQQGTTNGTLARQETGSLLPVLAVRNYLEQQQSRQNIRRVLDLCSAPGSKTLQLVEWMTEIHEQQQQQQNHEPQPTIKPIVIRANDVNPRRLEELQDAILRSGVLSARGVNAAVKLKYTNQDASRYIDAKKKVFYDIILVDVPCSGDGTVRKDARVLPYWTPRTALGLHALQVKILTRSLHLLAVGGVAVYSTCSLNPVENEAVVAAAMGIINRRANESEIKSKGGGAGLAGDAKYRLVNVCVPEVILSEKCRRGILSWKVADYVASANVSSSDFDGDSDDQDTEKASLTWYETHDQARAAEMGGALPSMWPPARSDGDEPIPLDACLRLWPQDCDTGGFFVAMIERVK
ncbi:tRNA (cytosine-5-)-methyltransferase ncl1 [Mayamaea pseudoterrestris]|nr:tRNA (cytosine-5-)-methyltransferase ncl1 [Mayamaea pseudoterrestris]